MKKLTCLSRVIATSVLTIPLLSVTACGESDADVEAGAESGSDSGSGNSSSSSTDHAVDDAESVRSGVNAFFAGLEEPEEKPVKPGVTEVECTQGDLCPQDGPTADGSLECSYKHWENVEVFDSYAVFQPDLDRLYPGAIFRGGAYLNEGYLDEIVFPEGMRAPIEASFSLENTTESPTIRLAHPTLANYREERNRVLSGQNGNNPTTVQLSMQQVHSESHFSSAAGAVLGFGVGSAVGGVGGLFGAAFQNQKETKKNMYMLRLRQQNYQVNLTPKPTPGAYIEDAEPSVLLDEASPTDMTLLSQLIDDGVMPVVVSDLFYGRLVLCSVATYASEKETREAWMSAIAGVLVGSGVGVGGAAAAVLTEKQKQILAESRVDCFVNGGAGSDAVKTVQGVDGIVNAILGSGDQSKNTPGGLIGYRLTTLTNRELPIALTSNYTSEECLKTSGHLTMELSRIKLHGTDRDQVLSGDDDQEIYGKIGVTYPEPGTTLTGCSENGGTGGKTVMLFDRGRDNHVKVNNDFVVDVGTQSTEDVNAKAGAKVCVFAQLHEYDAKFLGIQFNKDDSLGSGWAWVDVKQWNGEFGLNLKNAVAHFRFDLSL